MSRVAHTTIGINGKERMVGKPPHQWKCEDCGANVALTNVHLDIYRYVHCKICKVKTLQKCMVREGE